MIKKNWLRRYQVIVILAVVAGIMGMIKLAYKDRKWEEAATPTPTVVENKDRGYPLWRLLPYSGDGFIIDHYITPWTLAVKITKGTKEEAEKKIDGWLEAQGELGKNHKLEWE